MGQSDALRAMLNTLRSLFADEGRPGGDEAAQAIAHVLTKGQEPAPRASIEVAHECEAALTQNPHPGAAAVIAALSRINWYRSGLQDGRIRPEIARHMATTELIGPDGMMFHPTVRIGLFYQSPGVDYVTRTHAAEETFVMLGGTGFWGCNGRSPVARTAGAYIHHPSYAPHVSVTRSDPFIAAWRWCGDIAYETYALKG